MEVVLKGVIIIERLVSPYANLLVVVSRKKGGEVTYRNAYSVNTIIVNNRESPKLIKEENVK